MLKGFRAYRCCQIPKTVAARKELNLEPVPSFDFQKELIVTEKAMQKFCTETRHVDMNEETSSEEGDRSVTPELEAHAVDMYSYELTPTQKTLLGEIGNGCNSDQQRAADEQANWFMGSAIMHTVLMLTPLSRRRAATRSWATWLMSIPWKVSFTSRASCL